MNWEFLDRVHKVVRHAKSINVGSLVLLAWRANVVVSVRKGQIRTGHSVIVIKNGLVQILNESMVLGEKFRWLHFFRG